MLKESAGLNLQNTIGILVTFKAPPVSSHYHTPTLLLHLPRGLSRIRLRVPEELTSQVLPLLLYYEAFLSYKKTDYHPLRTGCYLEHQYLSTVKECSFTRRNSPNFITTLVILQKLAPLDWLNYYIFHKSGRMDVKSLSIEKLRSLEKD